MSSNSESDHEATSSSESEDEQPVQVKTKKIEIIVYDNPTVEWIMSTKKEKMLVLNGKHIQIGLR
jgi:hypothetical protein